MVPLCLFSLWPHSEALDSEFKEVRERHLLLASNLSSALSRYDRDAQSGYEIVSHNLPIVAQLTALHDGSVVLDSGKGRGPSYVCRKVVFGLSENKRRR